MDISWHQVYSMPDFGELDRAAVSEEAARLSSPKSCRGEPGMLSENPDPVAAGSAFTPTEIGAPCA